MTESNSGFLPLIDECFSEQRKYVCKEYILFNKILKIFRSEINSYNEIAIARQSEMSVFRMLKVIDEKPDKLTLYQLEEVIKAYEEKGIIECLKCLDNFKTYIK
jgi:hypothetical protein